MTRWFADGGPFMFAVLLAGAVSLAVTTLVLGFVVVARMRGTGTWVARAVALTALLVVALAPCTGLLGWWTGLELAERAAQNASPEFRGMLLEEGSRVARAPLVLGSGVGFVVGIPASFALLLAMAPRRGPAS